MSVEAKMEATSVAAATENGTNDRTLAAPLEADDALPDDEGLGSDTASDTTSLKSSVLNFEIENGRRYHAFQKGSYNFPNDEEELDRMDLEHHIFRLMLNNKSTLTPLKNPSKILDLGTGTGIWAIEMAEEYPSAQVIGIDLSPVQPTLVPPNCEFLVDDFEQEWTWPDNSFDLIRGRLMQTSVADYPKLYKKIFQALKPGGYFELHDLDPRSHCDDGTLTPDSSAVRWGELLVEACAKIGRPCIELKDFRGMFEQAGLVDIKETELKRPHNAWAKDPTLKRLGMVGSNLLNQECANRL